MRNNNDAKITITVGTIAMAASLFIVTITMAPLQAYALSRYVVDDPNPADGVTNEKTDQSIQQDGYYILINDYPITLDFVTASSTCLFLKGSDSVY